MILALVSFKLQTYTYSRFPYIKLTIKSRINNRPLKFGFTTYSGHSGTVYT